jgi:hypothetical protein
MFIVWGKTVRRAPAGHALHFCSVCREPRICAVKAVRRVDHVYWIPLGRGQHVLDEVICDACESVYALGPNAALAFLRLPPSVDAALNDLPPELAERILARCELETRAFSGSLRYDERRGLIAEPLVCLSYEHLQASRTGSGQSVSAILQLLAIVGVVATAVLWFLWSDNPRLYLPWAVGASATTAVLIAIVLYRGLTDSRRITSTKFLGRLADSLRPLSPTRAELDDVLSALRREKVSLAAVSADDLCAAIQQRPTRG